MRKWFAYIERGFRKGYKKGDVIIFHRPSTYSGKGGRRLMELMNIKTGRINKVAVVIGMGYACLLYTSPSPRDLSTSRMPSSA